MKITKANYKVESIENINDKKFVKLKNVSIDKEDTLEKVYNTLFKGKNGVINFLVVGIVSLLGIIFEAFPLIFVIVFMWGLFYFFIAISSDHKYGSRILEYSNLNNFQYKKGDIVEYSEQLNKVETSKKLKGGKKKE